MDDSSERPQRSSSRPHDNTPLTIEELSMHARVSPAFIRLCIDLGCETSGGRLSQVGMIEWLAFNYEAVRTAAGLRAMAPIDGVRGRAKRALQLANTMLTLLEFAESRCTRLEEKERLRAVQKLVERTV